MALLVVTVLLAGLSKSFAQAPNTWTQKANFGGGNRNGAVAFSIGNKGYIGTGSDSGFTNSRNDFWEYDPIADAWTQKANLTGGGRYLAVGFSIGSKGYIGTGYLNGNNGTPTDDFREYDPVTNTWTQKAGFAGGPRARAVGFSIGNKGYMGTGCAFNSAMLLSDFWEYNPAINSWTQRASLSTAMLQATGFRIGNRGYVGLGLTPLATADFYEYNPVTNNWAPKASYPGGPRAEVAGFNIGTKGYIGTGATTANLSTTDFWEYDPSNNTWTQKANFGGVPRAWATGFSIGGKGYMGTGLIFASPGYKDIWEYTPAISISTDSIIGNSYCGGDTIPVSFNIAGAFNSGNIFTAQLSNALGSFAAPMAMGSLSGIFPGIITAVIPIGIPAGTGYRIRVVSSSPAFTGADNGINLSINTGIPSSVTISTPLDTVCVPFPVTFTAVGVNTGSNPVYQWKRNGVNTGPNSPSFTYVPANKDTITCVLTNSLTCAVPPNAVSNVIVLTVNPPNLSVVPASATFCQGDSVILRAVDSTTPGLNYQWQRNSNNIPGATTYHYTAKSTGAYTLVFNVGNCTAGSPYIPVNVTTGPVPFIHLLPNGKMQTDFYVSYQWYFNDTLIAGATAQSYTATQNGAYKVTVVDANGCMGTSLVVHFPWVGVETVSKENALFNVYPNPASGKIRIVLQSGIKDEDAVSIILYDITGKSTGAIFSGSAGKLRKDNFLPLPAVSSGLYFIKLIVNTTGSDVRKLSIR